MQGYRTILFTVIMATVGMLGVKISPDLMNHWLDVFCAAWAIGAILLRVITTTPIGGAVNSEISFLSERVQSLLNNRVTSADVSLLASALHELFGKLEAVPALGEHNVEILKKLDALLFTVQTAAHPVEAMAEQALSPAALEPVATQAAEAAVSAIAGDGAVPLLPAAPAQPVIVPAQTLVFTPPAAPVAPMTSIIPAF